ncbi:MAG TPA: orotidine-5'-phosphate decarboxylase, partial [Negativicutes bacterium]|nr:orotidine-5'-phosphate decarboxylase [Negativicutes bacterium]
MTSDNRLIVALDFADMDKVQNMVTLLGDAVGHYKVGMELFYAAGSEAIRFLRAAGKEVFLDLKLHDIPNTVGRSAGVLAGLGATMFNVHAAGGTAMMKAAALTALETAATSGRPRSKVIAVTVLTSLDEGEWTRLNCSLPIAAQAVHLAVLAKGAGLDGVVASPQEAAAIRAACGPDFLIVTPGVRPAGSAVNDQSRVATPAGALKGGASHLVVGRPITAAPDPRASA